MMPMTASDRTTGDRNSDRGRPAARSSRTARRIPKARDDHEEPDHTMLWATAGQNGYVPLNSCW
jgi:hypothetical protein